jgi:hypothetical protein
MILLVARELRLAATGAPPRIARLGLLRGATRVTVAGGPGGPRGARRRGGGAGPRPPRGGGARRPRPAAPIRWRRHGISATWSAPR